MSVEDGAVTLTGTVSSYAAELAAQEERRAVIDSVSHAPVVRKVNDHLHIDPYF